MQYFQKLSHFIPPCLTPRVFYGLSRTALDAAGVTPTANMQLRFTVNDGGGQSIVESALDAVRVLAFTCHGGVPCLRGDLSGDGGVDGRDLKRFVDLIVSGGGSTSEICAGDLNLPPNGRIDMGDVDDFVSCLLAGGCP